MNTNLKYPLRACRVLIRVHSCPFVVEISSFWQATGQAFIEHPQLEMKQTL